MYQSVGTRSIRRIGAVLVAVTALALASCGGDDDTASDATASDATASEAAPSEGTASGSTVGAGGVGGTAPSDVDQASKTFVVAQTAPIEFLTPHGFNQSNMTWDRALYDALTIMAPDPQPHLATGWEVSEDGTEYTFTLADGVTFWDGTPLTAQIVVDNLTWATDPANLVTGGALLATAEITAVDDSTVKLVFPTPAPQLLSTLAIIPIMDLTTDLATTPNGTGPYKLEQFVPNSVVSMSANPEYWDAEHEPQVGTYEVRVFSDNASALAALSSGQVQAFAFPPFNQVGQLESEGYTIATQPAPGNFILRMNTVNGPIQDKRVRQALSLALDRQTFVDLTGSDLSEPTCNIYPSSSPAYVPELDENCAQDLEAAKALLVEAGYGDGLDLTLDVSAARHPELSAYAPVLQESLRSIGVNLELNEVTATVMGQRILDKSYQMSTDWYPWGNLDPALLFVTRTFTPDLTLENYVDPAYTQMVADAQGILDEAERTAAYQDINRYLVDQSFVIPIASRPYTYAVHPDVATFEFDPFGMAVPTSAAFAG